MKLYYYLFNLPKLNVAVFLLNFFLIRIAILLPVFFNVLQLTVMQHQNGTSNFVVLGLILKSLNAMYCQCKMIYMPNQSKVIVGMTFKLAIVKDNKLTIPDRL